MLICTQEDSRLRARVLDRWALRYDAGADPTLDRPGHVRAASGLAWFRGQLAVVQDDASFLALIDPRARKVGSWPLPAGPGGVRLFDDGRGNKLDKLDLESCVSGSWEGEDVLLAFGSGSRPERERVAVIRGRGPHALGVELVDAGELYAALRADRGFSGSELNLEGAALLQGGVLRLAQRGNGTPRDGLDPRDATCDLSWDDLLAYLGGRSGPPTHGQVVAYELGELDGVGLTFTDLCAGPGGKTLYLAGAEDSPDAVRDGPVTGAAIGVLTERGGRWTPLRDREGAVLTDKAEGLVLDPSRQGRALVVVDPDRAEAEAELLEVALEGPW